MSVDFTNMMRVIKISAIALITGLGLIACSEGQQQSGPVFTQQAKIDTDKLAEEYVFLVLSLGEHDEHYVDAYYGPEKWREEARTRALELSEIRLRAQQLQAKLAQAVVEDKLRHHYLTTQLRALVYRIDQLSGRAETDFDIASMALYDTQAPQHDYQEFDQALAELETLLAGDGELTDRIEQFQAQFYIPKDRQQAVFKRAIEECKRRTLGRLSLPEGENFTLEYVTDKPWSGYNWYQGEAQSLIQLNVELPIEISRAVDLGCHEGYPGHHTYNALLEHSLVKQKGWVEFSVYPLFSPQSLIAEGSANLGIEMAFPGPQKMQFETQVLYPLAGIDPTLAPRYQQFNQIKQRLSYASNQVAREYLNGDISEQQAVDLLIKYSLYSEQKARQRVRFFDTYGAYVINYNWGKDLVKGYIQQVDDPDQRWQRFQQLLSSPRVPSSLSW